MKLSTSERIKIICKRKGIVMANVAEATGQSRQNLSNKLSRNNFTEAELQAIADAIGCTYESAFIDNETGERY